MPYKEGGRMNVRMIIAALAATIVLTGAWVEARAFELGLGGTVWYSWWQPAFGDWLSLKREPGWQEIWSYRRVNQNFFGGPLVTMKFNERVSWSNAFYLGRYDAKAYGTYLWYLSPTSPPLFVMKNNNSIWKYDADSVINISLLHWLSLFTGLKYQHYNIERKFNSGQIFGKDKVNYNACGAAVGLGFTVPIAESFFLMLNASGLYQAILMKFKRKAMVFNLPMNDKEVSLINHGIGINATVSFAYYIQAINLTISPGFRYQMIYFLNSGMNGKHQVNDNRFDHFYGATLTVIYNIKFDKSSEKKG
jgi:hypothetical protein